MKFNYKFSVGDTVYDKEGNTYVIDRRIGSGKVPKYRTMSVNSCLTWIFEESALYTFDEYIMLFNSNLDITEIDGYTIIEDKPKTHEKSETLVRNQRKEKMVNFFYDDSISVLIENGRNLSKKAYENELAPCFNREKEIESIQYTLYRRTKPNIMLLGKAGVGKTAIAEQLARNFNESYLNGTDKTYTMIIELSLNETVAGTKYRGDFEEKMKKILDSATQKRDYRLVLFIDEIHTINLIGNGEASASAGQVLKPALARGDISVIGATTTEEYKKYIATDTALARRFNCVEIKELSGDTAREVCGKILADYTEYFGINTEKVDIGEIYDKTSGKLKGTFPDNMINLIDETLAFAKYKGLTEIDNNNFDFAIEKYGAKEKATLGFR